jgi:hypothetical protein
MKSIAITLLVLLLISAAACVPNDEMESDEPAVLLESTLVGQVLLPRGIGSRGVELIIKTKTTETENRKLWVLFDEAGGFTHTFRGSLTSVQVTAAAEVHRFDEGELPKADPAGRVDVGVIDLRDHLKEHRFIVRAAEGKPSGVVRVAMWSGLPPTGPQGEPVSLGSRQFPPVVLGSEMSWLLPNEASEIHFLVERPFGAARGKTWRSGQQQLFGPFNATNVPAELVID